MNGPAKGCAAPWPAGKSQITSRNKLAAQRPELAAQLPPLAGGLECVIVVDDKYAATYRFRDQPRREGLSFVHHLAPKHHFDRVLLVSGDRESEVRYLADKVGIKEVYAEQSPEDKVNIVRRETQRARRCSWATALTTPRRCWPPRLAWRSARATKSRATPAGPW